MSDISDLIYLSPRAPSPEMLSSSQSLIHPTDVRCVESGVLPRAPSTPHTRCDSDTIMAHPVLDQQELAPNNDEERAKEATKDYIEKMEADTIVQSQYGSVVVISPLPKSVTNRDILCRVRGGKVLSCILSQLFGCPLAAVRFQDPASAQSYVDFCAEPASKGLWEFRSGPESVPPSDVDITSHVSLHNDSPGLGDTWCSEDIPGYPKAYPPSTTRCLYLEACHMERAQEIWRQLGLGKSEYLRSQLEDMWLGQPEWDDGRKTLATLHIWFTDIKSAIVAKQRIHDLEYEADPCSKTPQATSFLGLRDPQGDHKYGPENDPVDGTQTPINVPVHHHRFPFESLLDLNKKSVLNESSRGALDPSKALRGHHAPQAVEVPIESMCLEDRLLHVLRTHGKGEGNKFDRGARRRLFPTPGAIRHIEHPQPLNSLPSQLANPRPCDSLQPQASADGEPTSSPSPSNPPNYSRENWNNGRHSKDVFWTVSMDEFLAMTDEQWQAFGTSFYIPPPGYNTAEKHVVELP